MGRIIGLILCFSTSLSGQSIKGGVESDFVFKIKQLDEFLDRFNHDPHTLALRQSTRLTHRENLYSLFDQERENWDYHQVEAFVEKMQERPEKRILDFYDPDWYAELECFFSYRGRQKKITLILQNQSARNGGSKWVIVSIRETLEGDFCVDIPKAEDAGFYLNPMSHVTDFMELERAFDYKEGLQNLFDPWNQEMNFLAFKHGLWSGSLKYEYHDRITYHFLQLDNWIFTVNYFPRQHFNSGWLISSLTKATREEKQQYRAKKLRLL